MKITTQKKHISSLELMEQINIFRKEVEGKSELQHKDLMKVIRDEFEDEIAEGIISPGSYKDKQNQSRPLFNLSINQAKQVLVRESKAVRRAIIKQLEEYEKGELTLTEKQKIEIQKNEAILKIVNDDGEMGIQEKVHYIKIIEDCDKKKFLIQSKEEILMSEIPKVVKAAASIDCYDEEYVASKNWNTKDLRDCLCKDKVLNKINDGVYEIGENFEALFLKPILGNYKRSKTNNVFIPVFYRSSLEYFKSKTFIYALNQHLKNKKEYSNYESGEIINYEDNWE